MPHNPFVPYLNRYTTASLDHEAALDEFIGQTPPPRARSWAGSWTPCGKSSRFSFTSEGPANVRITHATRNTQHVTRPEAHR